MTLAAAPLSGRRHGHRERRVLHVSQVSETGGLTHCVADYVRLQREQGWDVTVACPPGDLQRLAGEAGADVVTWHASRQPGTGLVGEVRTLRQVVAAADPGLVHLHSSKAGLVGRLVLRGRRPTVFSPHSWSFHAVDGLLRVLALLWERVATRWAGVVLCVSEAEKAEGLAAGVRGRYAVLVNAVDLRELPDAERDPASARAGLGVPPAAPMVLCLGRLCRQKGQDVLLDAWALVRQQVPGARLYLVGGGPDQAEVERRVAGLSGVVLVGAVGRPTALQYVVAADVVALPSRWEGMSLTLLEAQALGRYVVASDVAGAREVLSDGRGAVVPPEDVGALASAVSARLLSGAGPVSRPELAGGQQLTANVETLTQLYRGAMERPAV